MCYLLLLLNDSKTRARRYSLQYRYEEARILLRVLGDAFAMIDKG